jgi:hypothetical protein
MNTKIFNFGKIAYSGKRKINTVTVTISLNDKENRPVFSVSGNIWNLKHTDIICCGQCLDEISHYVSDPVFKKIYRLWKAHHLNDMHAGTTLQEQCLEDHKDEMGFCYDYTKACEILKKYNLYIDNGYKYGTGWLYREIPEADLNEIKELLKD